MTTLAENTNDISKIPDGFTMQEVVTLPNNFVTAYHTLVMDRGLSLPWPRPAGYVPQKAKSAILIWGCSSSGGQYALQILKYFGYHNLLATASKKHHGILKSYGAAQVFDYHDTAVIESIIDRTPKSTGSPAIPFILDCIGSQNGSLRPVAKLAENGAKVAVLLPVIIRDATETDVPEYSMDVEASAPWTEGVEVFGVRTHFYLNVRTSSLFD